MATYGIDKGHCLSGVGTGSQGCGYKEEILTRELGDKVITILRGLGHAVIDCTVDKSSNQLKDRVTKANAQILDMFVSIHFNACVNDHVGNGKTTGVEVFTYSNTSKINKKANDVCNGIAKLGLKNRGVKVGKDLYVVKNTKAPAMLIEVCFIDDRDDMNIYVKNVDKVAKTIAESIVGYSIEDKPTTAKKGVYRVVTGSYEDKDNALAHQKKLNEKGVSSFLIYTEV